jgi:hypothetical protein
VKRRWQLTGIVMALPLSAMSLASESELLRCRFPDPPVVPDATRADAQQMQRAADEVRIYLRNMQGSLDCLADFEQSLGLESSHAVQAQLVTLHNNGIDQMTTIAEAFNRQLKAFDESTRRTRGSAEADSVPPERLRGFEDLTPH